MSTNPNDIVRVRARANGRASVYEANAWCQSLSQGVLDGNGVVQNTSADMNVLVGGTSSKPDVVIASNPSGYKVALDIVGQQAVAITVPASNKRITSIVAYTDDLSLASTDENITGSPSSCGLIVVNGTASASPSVPDDATIRTAITADGATGSQACYCVLAEILVDHTTTTITNSLIDNKISGVNQIADLAVKSNSIDFTTLKNSFPVVETTNQAGYNQPIAYTRFMNIVIARMQNNVFNIGSNVPKTADSQTPGSYVPQGYRPNGAAVMPITSGATGVIGTAALVISASGEIKWNTSYNTTGNTRAAGLAVWITDDPWPTN